MNRERMAGALAALALAGLVAGGAGSALAGDPAAEAWRVGGAGQARAAAIARDGSNASQVPGHAGTDLPERDLDAGELAGEARERLGDPHDPGGAAGRAVIEGIVRRPAAPVPANDPGVTRARAVESDPRQPAYRADGIVTGESSECRMGVRDAGRGGSCGRVRSCVGAGCETVAAPANTGFARSAATLNMVLEMGGDEFDRGNLRFFAGERRACRIRFGGLANCCRNSGILVGLVGCSAHERWLAEQRHAGNTHYLGKRCTKKIFGFCLRRERAWCVFGSRLGRILHEEARPQLGMDWGSCRGFTVDEIERIDFDRVDLSEFHENLMDPSRAPGVSLPDAGQTGEAVRARVRDFYRRGQ